EVEKRVDCVIAWAPSIRETSIARSRDVFTFADTGVAGIQVQTEIVSVSYGNISQDSDIRIIRTQCLQGCNDVTRKAPGCVINRRGTVVFILARKRNQGGVDSRRSHPIDLNQRASAEFVVIVSAVHRDLSTQGHPV